MIDSLTLEQKWVNDIERLNQQPDDNTLNWLEKPYVLSQAFKKTTQDFNVKVINQGFGLPLTDEMDVLNEYLDVPCRYAFIRQVMLRDKMNPLSYGRVIIPGLTYEKHFARINRTGNNPFGETVLYSHPDFTRSPFEFLHLEALEDFKGLSEKFPCEFKSSEVWGRRSVFCLSRLPILVVELFMPDLPNYPG